MSASLSDRDRQHLQRLDHKLQVVRDRVAGVVQHRHTGFFLGGRGGIGKTWTIVEELRRLEASFRLSNSRMTARALVDCLAECPDSVHLIEDIESLLADRQAVGVLRSALWGSRTNREGSLDRLVTWRAHRVSIEFVFTGGIIMTANRMLADLPELDALKTRISWVHLRVTDDEVAALMRHVAEQGCPPAKPRLDSIECREVVDFIIAESRRLNRELDMRLLTSSFEDRLQAEDFESGCNWKDLIAARICDRPTLIGPILPVGLRREKKSRQLAIARQIVGMDPDTRFQVWQERTGGASRATMYRRLAELAEVDAMDFGPE